MICKFPTDEDDLELLFATRPDAPWVQIFKNQEPLHGEGRYFFNHATNYNWSATIERVLNGKVRNINKCIVV